ncbi:MAG: RsmB/NOP family class I SAM-dependent RNA methyltransferase [Clostridia bacterium]|nr:RsmB/NOP family class I SAM-dependent RNA methyltransferase [Clostridia bacterium]MBR1685649.1 RsmB/NOP family class I SAM-dependent RNA methyltransferase [Clostridia bacterium]
MDERIPEYLRVRLDAVYGVKAQDIEAGFRANRPVTLRVNRLAATTEEVLQALSEEGVKAERVDWYEDALVLPEISEAQVEKLPVYSEGKIYLQSLSSMIPPLLLEAKAGESILDMAAAPGGKTTQIASLTGDMAYLTACERDGIRLERLKYNLKSQHVKSVTVMKTDARQLDDFFRFDRILLDAPCTGSGTIDLREGAAPRRMTADWVKKTVKTQKALVDKAVKLLKSGGTLVYSTCSVLPEENEEVVAHAVSRGLTVQPISEKWTAHFPCLAENAGTCTLCPDARFEGFFISVLRK